MDIREKLKTLKNLRDKAVGAGAEWKDIENISGVSRQHIERIEKGQCGITVEKLNNILKAYNTTLQEFFESPIPNNFPSGNREIHEKVEAILVRGGRGSELLKTLICFIEKSPECYEKAKTAKGKT